MVELLLQVPRGLEPEALGELQELLGPAEVGAATAYAPCVGSDDALGRDVLYGLAQAPAALVPWGVLPARMSCRGCPIQSALVQPWLDFPHACRQLHRLLRAHCPGMGSSQ